ncbi:myoD family inhibitor domain-containing protein isoform X2 [Trachypithecus francoisi]|uniref:myoD family inhibitor domain-containing protein isoform X2 n=1 Tax=Trachypithecus francoisi TaxID=54180 RepID=UPI00141A9194|nr:myoD family inhibitor domain-containing protein isoform X2 [Trachypithecus francoisi]
MSGAGETLAPGPAGPQRAAEAGGGRLGSTAQGKCDKDNTEKDITQATNSHFTHGEMQDQSIWGNPSDGELVRTQPQRLPQLQTSAQVPSDEEIGKIKNGHTGLSNGNGIHHGAKHGSADNRKLSAPVSQKMHRKIQSSLSVNSDISKKSKVNAVFSQKTGSSPEGKLHKTTSRWLTRSDLPFLNITLPFVLRVDYRLLRPLYPGLLVLRIPDPLQYCPGTSVLWHLHLRSLLLLLWR